MEIRIPMEGLFDLAAEKTRLAKEQVKIQAEPDGLRQALGEPAVGGGAKPGCGGEPRETWAELDAPWEVGGILAESGRGREVRRRRGRVRRWCGRPSTKTSARATSPARRPSRRTRVRAACFWPSRSWWWRDWTSRVAVFEALESALKLGAEAREGDRFFAGTVVAR